MPLEKLKQHLSKSEWIQARRESERLIHTGELTGADLVQAFRGAAQSHFHLQDIFAAIKLGEMALDKALPLGNWELIGKARYDVGAYYTKLGDPHQAREHLEEFLANFHRYPQLELLQARAYHNLALTLRQRKQYVEAVSLHERSARIYEQLGDLPGREETNRGIIWCHLAMGEPHQAWPYIEGIARYLAEFPNDQLRSDHLTDLACYHRLTGDLKTSMVFCEEVLVPGRAGVDDHILATACAIAGENALDLGNFAEARTLADLAMNFALKAKGPFLMNQAAALRRRLVQVGTPSAD